MPEGIKKFGLKKLPKDRRDFKLSAIIQLPKLEELPEEFELPVKYIKNQLDSDYCTGMATCGISELQEGVELSPEWAFAISKMISGDPDSWGLGVIDGLKAITKYGYVTKEETKDITFKKFGDHRYIENWPKELFEKAAKRKKSSYFQITGPYDHTDNIRASIYLFKDKKQLASLGVVWGWSPYDKIMEEVFEKGFQRKDY